MICLVLVGCTSSKDYQNKAHLLKVDLMLPDWVSNPSIQGALANTQCTKYSLHTTERVLKLKIMTLARAELYKNLKHQIKKIMAKQLSNENVATSNIHKAQVYHN